MLATTVRSGTVGTFKGAGMREVFVSEDRGASSWRIWPDTIVAESGGEWRSAVSAKTCATPAVIVSDGAAEKWPRSTISTVVREDDVAGAKRCRVSGTPSGNGSYMGGGMV